MRAAVLFDGFRRIRAPLSRRYWRQRPGSIACARASPACSTGQLDRWR